MAAIMIPTQNPKPKTIKRVAKKKPIVEEEVDISIDLPKIIKERDVQRKIDVEMQEESESDESVESFSSNKDSKRRKNDSATVMEMDLFNIPGNRNKRPSSDFNIENQFRISDNLVFFTSSSYNGIKTGKIRKYWLKDGKHQVSAYGGEMLKADIPKFVSWLQKTYATWQD